MIRLQALAIILYISSASACFSFGCVGGIGGGMCGCPFGMCLATPPCMGRMCSARARAAKIYREDDKDLLALNTEDPNEHFLNCCGLLEVPIQCLGMCTFDGYNSSSVQSVLSLTSTCPFTALPHIHFCAARGADHTECCRAGGVTDECLMFCDQSPDTTNQLTLQHLQCVGSFDTMKDCFTEHALTEYYQSKQAAIEKFQKVQLD
ncbi:unnamed protein product [Cylicocyclus nassatus]|uniref:Domain of unknown function DB domain-containing protein n=1 Tax=Cylicocyclus nassatus TaxID=53992 RepID=A0AA36DR57_CYLNA|nr:unnamed protein product [Cylicocyclus nassatus]